ncbi:MAG: transcription elongation factor GreAB [Myxococcota bacterium]
MDKRALVAALQQKLREEYEVVAAAVAAAREGATHEEAKPENEYDTRGLEQSYLAGAQTARAEAVLAAIAELEHFRPKSFSSDGPIGLGACVLVDDGREERRYFLCGHGGGSKLELEGHSYVVLAPGSPLSRKLFGKRIGDVVEHGVRGEDLELEIIGLA